ncbi:MAG: DUF4493 domain-containing protein [Muribaculaceae bacterium]|nr:DUF4493 domain-containing protein [Muribaculaceae bacterium]
MKQIYAGIFLAGASISLLASCSGDDNPWNKVDGEGGAIHLTVASDGNVFRSTRADDTKATIVPDAHELAITLSRTDGSSNQNWVNLDAFNNEPSFPIGEYKIAASFGDIEAEGFTNPYYYASETVNVTAGDEKNVNLTATLANCMVSVRYTDEFNAIYPQHSAAVKSTGHDYVAFAGDEIRPAYMMPSAMSLALTMTNSAGKQVTIQPAGFTAQARRHYIITIGVNGTQEQGNRTLDIQFEEEVVSETVNVSLDDELFSAPAPTVLSKDFTPGESENTFESLGTNNDPRFEVYAFGGLKEVTLTLAGSSTYNSPFGKEAQLVNASQLVQSNIEASGMEVYGLFRNPDKMGIVKLKGMIERLPVGTHTVTLQAQDVMTRLSDPVSYTVVVSPVAVEVRPAAHVPFTSRSVEVYVSTNCPDIRNKSTFTVTQDELDATITKVETLSAPPVSDIPASLTYHYKYTLQAPRDLMHDQTPVRLFYGTKADARATVNVTLDFPKFSIETDPFAQKVIFRIVPENDEDLEVIEDNLVIIRDGKQVDPSRVSALSDRTGEIEVKGLAANSLYSNVEFALAYASNPRTPIASFTTENAAPVPNGQFDDTVQTMDYSDIQIGGQYRVSPVDYTLMTSIVRSEAEGWASLNSLTCYSGSTNKNTWFMVPSTFHDAGVMRIRSVGYNHNGTTPARSGGAFNTTYYCENSPTQAQLEKSRGELFLGSYSFDGSAHRTDGIAFTSRPTGLQFSYQYTSVNNELAEAVVIVYDASDKEIARGSLELNASVTAQTKRINLSNYGFGKKAAKLYICFRSTSSKTTTPAINIPTGIQLNEGQGLGSHTKSANDYKAFAMGSELLIDNVVLTYN